MITLKLKENAEHLELFSYNIFIYLLFYEVLIGKCVKRIGYNGITWVHDKMFNFID